MLETVASNTTHPPALLLGLRSKETFESAMSHCAEALDNTGEINPALNESEADLRLYLQQDKGPNTPKILALLAEFEIKRGDISAATGLLFEADLLAKGKLAYRTRLLELLLMQGHRETARKFALKWLKARSHTGLYWWFYGSLVENINQYQALLDITPKPAKTAKSALKLAHLKARATARAAHRVGKDDKAFAIYSDLLQKDLDTVDFSNKANLVKRRKADKTNLQFLQVPALPARPKASPADLVQATYEQMQQCNWNAVLKNLSSHSKVQIGASGLVEKITALADVQKFQAWPQVSQPNAAVLKATEILATKLTHFWLDSGSLLGLVRNKRPISWDNDIDFGIWDDEIPAMLALNDELAEIGYRVSHRSYYGKIYGGTIKIPGMRAIHIHVFYRTTDDVACSPQTLCYYKPATRPDEAVSFADHPIMRNALCKARNSSVSYWHPNPVIRAVKKRFTRRIWGLFLRLRATKPREKWTTLYPYKALYATGTWRVPAHYFDQLTRLKIDGISIPVPADTKNYLELRYQDWRTPQQNWCYWLDDGAQTPQSPESLGLGYLFKDAK